MDIDVASDPVELQIGAEGRDYIAQLLKDVPIEQVPQFMTQFRKEHSVRRRGIEPALCLLEMGGVSRHAAHTAILKAVKDELLKKIKHAADAGDQDKLSELFHLTKRYITVEQLRDVAVAVLERVDDHTIGDTFWSDIVEEGLNNRPYIDLTTALKRRVWEVRKDAFEYEIAAVLTHMHDYSPPEDMEKMMDVAQNSEMTDNKQLLDKLLELSNRGEPRFLTTIIDKFIDAARAEVGENRRVALANLFTSLLSSKDVVVANSSHKTRLGQACRAAKLIVDKSKEVVVKIIGLQELRVLKAWTAGEEADGNERDMMEIMALLVHSTAARDLFANQLTMRLFQLSTSTSSAVVATPGPVHDQFVKDLTFMVLASVNAKSMLESRHAISEKDVTFYCNLFYPMIVQEMKLDAEWRKNSFHVCVALPDDGICKAMHHGCLERRILCTYIYTLFAMEFTAGVARFRMALDTVCAEADKPGEEREFVIARSLLEIVCGGDA